MSRCVRMALLKTVVLLDVVEIVAANDDSSTLIRKNGRNLINLFILVDVTIPRRIRPRMLTLPTNGHFLSMYLPFDVRTSQIELKTSIASLGVLMPRPTSLTRLSKSGYQKYQEKRTEGSSNSSCSQAW